MNSTTLPPTGSMSRKSVAENSACFELLRHMAPMSPWPKRIMILGRDSLNGKHEEMRGKESNTPYLG